MKKKRFILRLSVLGIILVALVIPLVYAFMNDDDSTVKVGDTAPDFALTHFNTTLTFMMYAKNNSARE